MTLRAANLQIKMKHQLLRLILIFICLAVSSGIKAQIGSERLKMLGEFEIPKTEDIEFLKNTSTGSPILLSTKGDIIYIRPIDTKTGQPIRLLSIRSNETKKIRRHVLRGDSLYCLIKSIENNQPDGYESVIYSLRGDVLAEAHRHQVNFDEAPDTKTAQTIHFTASINGKLGLIVRQDAFMKNSRASVFVEITKHPEEKVESHKLKLPFDSDDIEVTGVSITNKGVVNIIVKTGIKINSPFLRKHLIYSFIPETLELHEFDLSLDKIFLKEVILKSESSKTLVIGTYASDPFEQTYTDGFVFLCIDTSGTKISDKSVVTFNDGVISSLQTTEGRKLSHVEHLFPSDIAAFNDEVVAVLSQEYLDQVCTTDPRTGIITCTDQYHYDGILLQSTTQPESNTVIGRRQTDYKSKGPFMGHQSYGHDDKVLVFYNDHVRNDSTFANRIMNNPARSVLRYVSTDASMNQTSGLLPGGDFIQYTECPGFIRNGIVHMLFSDGRSYKIGMIQSDELD